MVVDRSMKEAERSPLATSLLAALDLGIKRELDRRSVQWYLSCSKQLLCLEVLVSHGPPFLVHVCTRHAYYYLPYVRIIQSSIFR